MEAEGRMSPRVFRLWETIRIVPEKWREAAFGDPGGGFWVVAIIGRKALWYNDIEDGFNCSSYYVVGTLAEYWCNQDGLEVAVQNLLSTLDAGVDPALRLGLPVTGPYLSE
ncbi:hypothetical protein ASD28_27180 [Massilia sp. Root133]|nr:hypothetical protein ASD28_27180 [Massilia sp. Root133]KQZ40705.1 hypothetical protein ASD92_30910 [Massilia sp. Root1485]